MYWFSGGRVFEDDILQDQHPKLQEDASLGPADCAWVYKLSEVELIDDEKGQLRRRVAPSGVAPVAPMPQQWRTLIGVPVKRDQTLKDDKPVCKWCDGENGCTGRPLEVHSSSIQVKHGLPDPYQPLGQPMEWCHGVQVKWVPVGVPRSVSFLDDIKPAGISARPEKAAALVDVQHEEGGGL